MSTPRTPRANGAGRIAVTELTERADPGYMLPLLARAAAERRRKRKEPLSRSEALAEAPWDPETMPPAWERPFREAYADQLETRGLALPAARPGARSPGGATKLVSGEVLQTREEIEEQRALAKAAGISWSAWMRRAAAEAVARAKAK